MGNGIEFECKKCGNGYSVSVGIGFLYPLDHKKIRDDMKKGKYGEEFKKVLTENKNAVVNAENLLFVCPKCSGWSVEPDLSLYEPYSEKSAGEQFVMPAELAESYRRIKRYVHHCPKCSTPMRKRNVTAKLSLSCPECGEKNPGISSILWD